MAVVVCVVAVHSWGAVVVVVDGVVVGQESGCTGPWSQEFLHSYQKILK
jgi:hypothetical protein